MREPCAPLVDIPHRDLNEPETGTLWGTDRTNYGDCIGKNEALIAILPPVPAKTGKKVSK